MLHLLNIKECTMERYVSITEQLSGSCLLQARQGFLTKMAMTESLNNKYQEVALNDQKKGRCKHCNEQEHRRGKTGYNLKKEDRVDKQNTEFPHQNRWAGCCSIYTMRINQEQMNRRLAQVSLLDLFLPLRHSCFPLTISCTVWRPGLSLRLLFEDYLLKDRTDL